MNRVRKVIVGLSLIVCMLVVGVGGYVVGQEANLYTFSGGYYVGSPSYTIYKDGSNYYAKNAYDFVLSAATSSDCAVTWAAVRGELTTGGQVYFMNGVYDFGSSMVWVSGISVVGESRGDFESFTSGTVLRYVGDSINYFIDARECRDVVIKDLKVKGNGVVDVGIEVGGEHNDATKTKAFRFENLVIDGFDYGIQGYTFGADDSVIDNCFIGNNAVADISHLSSMVKVNGGTLYDSPIGVRVYRDVGSYNFVNVNANHNITAFFGFNSFNITAVQGSHGSVSPSGVSEVESGGSLEYDIVADSNYHIDDVLVDGVSVGVTDTVDFTNVQSNHNITAVFGIDTYDIVAYQTSNGVVSPSGTTVKDYGSSQIYNIVPNSFYHILDVQIDNVSVGDVSSYEFTDISADHNITATFESDVNPTPVPTNTPAPTATPYSGGSGIYVYTVMGLVVLLFFVVADFVVMGWFYRAPLFGYFVGLFSVLAGLYMVLSGVYSVSAVEGLFSMFTSLMGGFVLLVLAFNLRVRGK